LVFTSHVALSQGWITKNASVVVRDGVHVVITSPTGHYTNKGSGLVYSRNGSFIHLRGNWYNNGSNVAIATNDGTVLLDGGGQSINGSKYTSFNNLVLSGNGNKTLNVDALVGGGQSGVKSGVLSVNDKNLFLNSKTLIVNNPDPSSITRTTGFIIGETPPSVGYSHVQWNIRNAVSPSQYSIPFGSTDQIHIPFGFIVNTAGVSFSDSGFVKVAMYPTNPLLPLNNRPLPTGVSNLNNEFGIENDLKCLDRFYIVGNGGFGLQPKLSLQFPYIDREWDALLGGTNDVQEKELRAVPYNAGANIWQYPGGGTTDVINNNVKHDAGSAFAGRWVLFNWPSCPDAIFTFTENCFGTPTSLVNMSTLVQGVIDSVVWNFDGNTVTGLDSIEHIFSQDGLFPVKLKVRSDRGCWDSVTQMVVVHPLPIPQFTYTDTCLGQPTTFKSGSTTATGNPLADRWNSPGFNTGNGPSYSFIYPAIGPYTMTLASTNTWGCVDSISRIFQVRELPIVAFDMEDVCEGDVANFTDKTTGTATLINWTWKMNDEIFSLNQNSTRYMSIRGIFPIKLIVENQFGCIDSLTRPQFVKPKVNAGFTFWPSPVLISDPLVRFNNDSRDANNFTWDFGDGDGSNLENPEHVYRDTGTYIVRQIANNDDQCPDTAYRYIFVGPDIKIWIPNAFTPHGSDNINETFKPVGILHGLQEFYMEIYNRWGELLYVTHDITQPWDGTYRGATVESDNYLYLIKVVDIYRNESFYKGIVTVLR
jgi:gliding motility-associated-like protein